MSTAIEINLLQGKSVRGSTACLMPRTNEEGAWQVVIAFYWFFFDTRHGLEILAIDTIISLNVIIYCGLT